MLLLCLSTHFSSILIHIEEEERQNSPNNINKIMDKPSAENGPIALASSIFY